MSTSVVNFKCHVNLIKLQGSQIFDPTIFWVFRDVIKSVDRVKWIDIPSVAWPKYVNT